MFADEYTILTIKCERPASVNDFIIICSLSGAPESLPYLVASKIKESQL